MPSLAERFAVDLDRRLADALQELGDYSRGVLRESTVMSNSENLSLVTQEPSSFEIAVRDRSWDWLVELCRRLKIDLLLVDSRPSVLLPTTGDQAVRISAMLEHGEGALLTAISASLRERASQALDLRGLQIICFPVITERNACGALLVGRVSPSQQDTFASRSQLELVASWLTAAVDAHLLSPPAFPSSGLNRVAPLAQLLGQASDRESDRELIRLFGEAIAVWHDIEVSGYVETPGGMFARDVALPGTKKGERPATIPSAGLSDSTELVRLPQGHLDRFGLPVVTLAGVSLPTLVSGSIVVEVVFGWPGMGRLAYDAVLARDLPVVLATVLLATVLVVLGNLAADLGLAWADPRSRASVSGTG